MFQWIWICRAMIFAADNFSPVVLQASARTIPSRSMFSVCVCFFHNFYKSTIVQLYTRGVKVMA